MSYLNGSGLMQFASLNRSSSFLPSDVANLVAWYDANDLTTITETANRVSQWNDKSSEGNNLVQATGADQPLLTASFQNSKYGVVFDGVTEIMADLTTNTYTQPTTLFMVCSNPTEAGANRAMLDGDSARQLFNMQSVSQYRVYAGTSLVGGTLGSGVQLFRVKFNGASSSLHIDGSSILSGDAGTNSLEGFQIGGSSHFGVGGFANFGICEILFYDADVSAGDTTLIEAYLNSKWGL